MVIIPFPSEQVRISVILAPNPIIDIGRLSPAFPVTISLNGHYQGNATGETFNGNGKTDILVRHKGANAFIAECKFWRGQKHMDQAIDQLLRYVTWRDTKTAILLFSKQPLTPAFVKARECIVRHKNFHSEYRLSSGDLNAAQTEYRLSSGDLNAAQTVAGYRFTHPSDGDKLIYFTLMGFQITAARIEAEKLLQGEVS